VFKADNQPDLFTFEALLPENEQKKPLKKIPPKKHFMI